VTFHSNLIQFLLLTMEPQVRPQPRHDFPHFFQSLSPTLRPTTFQTAHGINYTYCATAFKHTTLFALPKNFTFALDLRELLLGTLHHAIPGSCMPISS